MITFLLVYLLGCVTSSRENLAGNATANLFPKEKVRRQKVKIKRFSSKNNRRSCFQNKNVHVTYTPSSFLLLLLLSTEKRKYNNKLMNKKICLHMLVIRQGENGMF